MSGKAFIGIDVAFAKRKFLPIVISRWVPDQLIPYPLRSLPHVPPRGLGNASILDDSVVQAFAIEIVDYIRTVCNILGVNPTAIALDAPSRPKPDGQNRRHSEVAMDAASISCFATPSASEFLTIKKKVRHHLNKNGAENRIPHANQLWMLASFELFKELSKVAPCIEVFPQAIVHWLGPSSAHKSRQDGLTAQTESIASATGWPHTHGIDPIKELRNIAFAPAHDALDAYMSSWVASWRKINVWD